MPTIAAGREWEHNPAKSCYKQPASSVFPIDILGGHSRTYFYRITGMA
ncbi:hypothetical protein [Paenibacillus sp. BIHB 4019]|nr:hypothetical protein [Paenibacillus sp. BIHB 4019]